MSGLFEHGNEFSCFTKSKEILGDLNNVSALKESIHHTQKVVTIFVVL
jgi:hypothetical protein